MKSVSVSSTIRDVAKKAGVSAATVSRVMNGNTGVREPARQAVQRVVSELGFVPNQNARRLSLGRTFTVGVVLPHFTQPSFVERLKGIESVLGPSRYDMSIANVEDSDARDRVFGEIARNERVDGLIVITISPTPDHLRMVSEAGLPMVLIDAQHPQVPSVHEDSARGARLATEHLLALGHTRIAFLSDPFESGFTGKSRGQLRYLGHCKALKQAGLKVDHALLRTCANSRQDAFKMASELITSPHPPTAIFAFSDVQAIGALQAARAQGVQVPGDLSIIGYDNIDMAEAFGLTTVSQSLIESGRMGAQHLLRIIENPSDRVIISEMKVSVQLIVRTSTGPVLLQRSPTYRRVDVAQKQKIRMLP